MTIIASFALEQRTSDSPCTHADSNEYETLVWWFQEVLLQLFLIEPFSTTVLAESKSC